MQQITPPEPLNYPSLASLLRPANKFESRSELQFFVEYEIMSLLGIPAFQTTSSPTILLDVQPPIYAPLLSRSLKTLNFPQSNSTAVRHFSYLYLSLQALGVVHFPDSQPFNYHQLIRY